MKFAKVFLRPLDYVAFVLNFIYTGVHSNGVPALTLVSQSYVQKVSPFLQNEMNMTNTTFSSISDNNLFTFCYNHKFNHKDESLTIHTCVTNTLSAPVAVAGNSLVLAGIWRNTSLRTPSYILLARYSLDWRSLIYVMGFWVNRFLLCTESCNLSHLQLSMAPFRILSSLQRRPISSHLS